MPTIVNSHNLSSRLHKTLSMRKDFSIMSVPAFALFKASRNLVDAEGFFNNVCARLRSLQGSTKPCRCGSNQESHKDIQTVRKQCLAKRCRGRLHRSAQGMACLDIEAFLEPRCRPAPLCRAARRTCSDSTLQNSAPVSGTTPRHPRQSCTRLGVRFGLLAHRK